MTVAPSTCKGKRSKRSNNLRIALPPGDLSLTQDEEWCVVRLNDKWREIRLHDYDELFSVPGLYERLICDILKCDSPARIRKLLEAELADDGTLAGASDSAAVFNENVKKLNDMLYGLQDYAVIAEL